LFKLVVLFILDLFNSRKMRDYSLPLRMFLNIFLPFTWCFYFISRIRLKNTSLSKIEWEKCGCLVSQSSLLSLKSSLLTRNASFLFRLFWETYLPFQNLKLFPLWLRLFHTRMRFHILGSLTWTCIFISGILCNFYVIT